MEACIHLDYGRVVGAYWSPVNSGLAYQSSAAAFLGVDGRALVYAYREATIFDKYANGGRGGFVPNGLERVGTLAEAAERGLSLCPNIRQALQDAIDAAIKPRPATSVIIDDWGNEQ
jgi:hypothetical protein